MTGVTGRKAEGDETARAFGMRASFFPDILREAVRFFASRETPLGNLRRVEGLVEIRNGCTPLRSDCSLSSSSSSLFNMAVAGRGAWW